MVKPFSLPELMARVRAILRRTSPERIASVLSAADIELDRESHRVTRNGRQIHLGPTEFRLLEFLMQSPGRVFSRAQLLDGVWGRNVYVDERTVDVHIGRLRKALMRGSGAGSRPHRARRGLRLLRQARRARLRLAQEKRRRERRLLSSCLG